jgi:hypothetical protein
LRQALDASMACRSAPKSDHGAVSVSLRPGADAIWACCKLDYVLHRVSEFLRCPTEAFRNIDQGFVVHRESIRRWLSIIGYPAYLLQGDWGQWATGRVCLDQARVGDPPSPAGRG